MTDLRLEATTHLVGHSLRECEGLIRGVMSSMLTDVQRAEVAAAGGTHRVEIEQICTLLGFEREDSIRAEWWTWAKGLHVWAHRSSLRAPRPVDERFRTWWAQGQAVLYVIVHRFETVYAEALPRVVALAVNAAPVADDLTELRGRIPHGEVALGQFFAEATPGWFPLLRQGGYFDDPTSLRPDEEGRVAYVPWPAGDYLVRAAADAGRQDEVVELALAVAGTDNPAAHEAVTDIGLAVPVGLAARLADEVAGFLALPFQWRLPLRAPDLIARFADGGEIDSALTVLAALLGPGDREGSAWAVRVSLDELVPRLFPQLGRPGVDFLAVLLDEEFDDNVRRNDHSYLWRPTLESGRRRNRRDDLVTALRDATARVVDADVHELRALVAMLEGHEPSIFSRLALDLVRRFPDDDLIRERLGDRERFADFNLEREWTLLAQAFFATLPDRVKQTILSWIEAGPDRGEVVVDEEQLRRWQRLQLVRLGDGLPEEWRRRRDEYVQQYGEPDARRGGRAVWSGNEPPVPKDELASKTIDEIRAFLDTWRPEAGFDGPSVEGLARVLTEAVTEDPVRFAAAAETFAVVEPTYARSLVRGLINAAAASHQFDWEAVLALAESAIAQPRELQERLDSESIYIDRGWSVTRLELARLLQTGMEKALIAAELTNRVWAILAQLIEDPEPDAEYERQWLGSMGPAGASLNTTRGAAMHALMQYMWWLKGRTPDGQAPQLEERLRDAFERHLDPGVDRSQTIRSVYGQWFPFIVAADARWAEEHVESIFEEEEADLGEVAWNSYLMFAHVYDDVARLLIRQYASAVERLAAAGEVQDDEPQEQLLGHLIALYVRELIELDGDVLNRFFVVAPIEIRAKLIEAIGTDLSNAEEVSAEAVGRLSRLWEARSVSALAAGGAAMKELRGFSWWFGSAKFEDEWSLAHLIEVLEAGVSLEFDHIVVQRLAALRAQRLLEVVQALAALIDQSEDPWFVLGSREEIRAILQDGIESTNNAVSRPAREATNRLIARGNADFGDLVE